MSDSEAIPAATLIVMREAAAGPPHLLMVERPRTMSFAGGAMVFPGGRIEPEDRLGTGDLLEAARRAAVRETEEETGLLVDLDQLVPFARWRPVLAQIERGEVRAIFPTIRNLERLAQFASFADARDHALSIALETITPWIEDMEGERWLTIPGHLGYPVTRERVDTALRT